ncbi:hypothetical protein [Amycolatopsis suaedae]|uniref:PBP domain-containing protein n=1 Tax=Amycolatopsis suaedae TaxID=2510978 RepID=A0A4Q7J172_9PSEU|nr:hypothetical protein [Amycolatopsis suaedae]RZQ59684.1 hypothetical protein EWH70_33200 [Amycolatopsis suaedae]
MSVKRCVVAIACAVLAVAPLGAPAAVAQPPQLPYQVTTTPADLSSVRDSDVVRLSIAGLPAGASATVALCPEDLRDALTFNNTAVSRFTNYCQHIQGVYSASPARYPAAGQPRNAATGTIDIAYPVSRGETQALNINWDPVYGKVYRDANGKNVVRPEAPKYSYKCDETSPCAIWVQITATPPGQTKPVTWLTRTGPVRPSMDTGGPAGCQPPAPGRSVTAAYPERLAKSAVAWNSLLCSPTGGPSPVQPLAIGEGDALAGFDKAERDLAYTGAGTALSEDPRRERVSVPVALNAVVLAAVGRQPAGKTDSGATFTGPITDTLTFDWSELANLIAKRTASEGFHVGGVMANGSTLVSRNPLLAGMFPQDRLFGDFGLSGNVGTDTGPLLLSTMLTQKAPAQWRFLPTQKGGAPVGVIKDYLAVNDGLVNIATALTKGGVRKQMQDLSMGLCPENRTCAGYVLTDLATAVESGWTPVALPNSAGKFVAPTPQSLQAAAAHLRPAEDGTLLLGDTGADQAAYPLTFAEHAVAPGNALVGADCTPRKDAQDTLRGVLTTAVGGGQKVLGPGMVPLTPDLVTTARERIAKVGAGPAGEACAENKDIQQNPPPPAGGPQGGGTGALPPGGPAGGLPAAGPGPDAGALTQAPSPATVEAAKLLAGNTRIPLFPGAGVLAILLPLVALGLLVVLPSSTAYLAAGRPVPAWLARAAGWVGQRIARLRGAAA